MTLFDGIRSRLVETPGLNVNILELAEAGDFARAAAALTDYLVHSERIVLAVYARQIAQDA